MRSIPAGIRLYYFEIEYIFKKTEKKCVPVALSTTFSLSKPSKYPQVCKDSLYKPEKFSRNDNLKLLKDNPCTNSFFSPIRIQK